MNCFRMDLKRSIFCKKFIFVVIATYLVLLASTWNEFQTSTWWGDSTGAVGSVNIISTTLAFDKFKVVIVFFLGGLYTGSYCSDENSRYLRSIFTRTTLLSYTISRFVVNFIADGNADCIYLIHWYWFLCRTASRIGKYKKSLLWCFCMGSSDDLFNYDGTSVWGDYSCLQWHWVITVCLSAKPVCISWHVWFSILCSDILYSN